MTRSTLYAGATLLTLGLTASPAQALLTNFQFDPDGAGAAAPRTVVNEYWDIGNSASVVSTSAPTAGGSFTFIERGVAQITGHDGSSGFVGFGGQITALFTVSGTATLGGSVQYAAGGTIQFFSATPAPGAGYGTTAGTYGADLGVNFLTLTTTGGSGLLFTTGEPNGLQTVSARVASLLPGWMFSASSVDLAPLVSSGLFTALTTVNASRVTNPNATLVSELGALFGPGFIFTNCLPGQTTAGCNGVGAFIISNNGQERFDVAAIPEPSTWAMLAVGLGLFGFMLRRRNIA